MKTLFKKLHDHFKSTETALATIGYNVQFDILLVKIGVVIVAVCLVGIGVCEILMRFGY